MTKNEAAFTDDKLEELLCNIPKNVILVGGQALCLWADFYGVDTNPIGSFGSLTKDADFLGRRSDVKPIANSMSGKAIYPSERAMTAIAGQVQLRLDSNEFLNIDVIHKVFGFDADAIRNKALEGNFGKATFLIMHPLDVFKSRIENLAGLKDKQNPEGIAQTKIVLQVVNKFIVAINNENEKSALKAIEQVASIAKSSAGRNVAKNYGIHFLDAIPVGSIKNLQFQEVRLPRLYAEFGVNSHEASSTIIQNADVERGRYRGVVIDDRGVIVTQHHGKGTAIAHEKDRLVGVVRVGQKVEIGYKDGKGTVKSLEKGKDVGQEL